MASQIQSKEVMKCSTGISPWMAKNILHSIFSNDVGAQFMGDQETLLQIKEKERYPDQSHQECFKVFNIQAPVAVKGTGNVIATVTVELHCTCAVCEPKIAHLDIPGAKPLVCNFVGPDECHCS